LDADFRRSGFGVTLSEDMASFEAVCRATGKFLPNTFNPRIVRLPEGDALWMGFHDLSGRRVATIAVRRFRLGSKTLGDWLSSLSFFYRNPIEDMPSGERFILSDAADAYASKVRGSCALIGGLWIDPDWRGRTTLADVATAAGSILALSRWDAAPVMAIVEDEVYAKNADKYRFDKAFDGVRWLRPHKPERTKMWLLCRTKAAIRADVDRYLATPDAGRMVVRGPRPVPQASPEPLRSAGG
jgi:hypothetical protein